MEWKWIIPAIRKKKGLFGFKILGLNCTFYKPMFNARHQRFEWGWGLLLQFFGWGFDIDLDRTSLKRTGPFGTGDPGRCIFFFHDWYENSGFDDKK